MTNIVVVDFAGTLIKAEVIQKAQEFRNAILERGFVTHTEHANPEDLYAKNREFVKQATGLENDMQIQYRKNDLARILLTGEQLQNQMSTNLFQYGMYLSANQYKEDMVPGGLVEALQYIQEKGYKLAIVSGVREDIISGMLAIAQIPIVFDYIYGQPPILGVTNEQNLDALKKEGTITHVLGDKMSDLEAAEYVGAKKIFVTWGHANGGEEKSADYVVQSPEELEKIF